jgi:hypothetical protein
MFRNRAAQASQRFLFAIDGNWDIARGTAYLPARLCCWLMNRVWTGCGSDVARR